MFISDILASTSKIERYTEDLSYEDFQEDELVQDAVIKNLLDIGEAVKNIPLEFRKEHTNIDWRGMAGLRDILVHAYFGVDLEIIWDIVENKVPVLKEQLSIFL